MAVDNEKIIRYLYDNISNANLAYMDGDSLVFKMSDFIFTLTEDSITFSKKGLSKVISFHDSELDSLYDKAINLYNEDNMISELKELIRSNNIDKFIN